MLGDVVITEYPEMRGANYADYKDFCSFRNDAIGNELYESLCDMVVHATFFVTESGYIGIGPPGTRIGDDIWVLFGGSVPFVLRPRSEEVTGNCYNFVGDSYVQGVMYGEAVEDCERDVQLISLH